MTLGERGRLIVAFDVVFVVGLNFDVTTWKHACSLLHSLYISHTHLLSEKALKGPEFSSLNI